MINADDRLTVEWLSINDIAFGDAQVCDLGKAEFYRKLMAAGPDGCHIAPPMVSPDPDVPGRYLLRDGKHRWLAQLALGRDRVRCLVVRPAEPPCRGVDAGTLIVGPLTVGPLTVGHLTVRSA